MSKLTGRRQRGTGLSYHLVIQATGWTTKLLDRELQLLRLLEELPEVLKQLHCTGLELYRDRETRTAYLHIHLQRQSLQQPKGLNRS